MQDKIVDIFSNLFVLRYRFGSGPQGSHPKESRKQFRFNGDLKSAIEEGRRHCQEVGFRFLDVTPFLSDLQSDEERMRNAS